MKIKIFVVGNVKESYLRQGISEFEKRLRPYGELVIREFPEGKPVQNAREKDIEKLLEEEGEKIQKALTDRDFVAVLAIEGKALSSEAFSKKLEEIALGGYQSLVFIIGGSHGLTSALKQRANWKISFSPMTFPHQLMRLLLLEQIYRAYKISHHEPYHK